MNDKEATRRYATFITGPKPDWVAVGWDWEKERKEFEASRRKR